MLLGLKQLFIGLMVTVVILESLLQLRINSMFLKKGKKIKQFIMSGYENLLFIIYSLIIISLLVSGRIIL